MVGFDDLLARWAEGHGAIVVVATAFLLGLRHATDPDHLVAVWGSGHAVSLLAIGLPIVLFHAYIPDWAQRLAEALIGVVIVALAVRLLLVWRRGDLHAHEHAHDGERHAHFHSHAAAHGHIHAHPVRSARRAFGIGTVHGV